MSNRSSHHMLEICSFIRITNVNVTDARHFVENAARRKRPHSPNLTLTQTKCGQNVSLGDYHLRNKFQNNAERVKDSLVVFDEVSFDEASCTGRYESTKSLHKDSAERYVAPKLRLYSKSEVNASV